MIEPISFIILGTILTSIGTKKDINLYKDYQYKKLQERIEILELKNMKDYIGKL